MPNRYSPDLRQLAHAVAVVEHGGIAAAARALDIAQPALSRSLRDLEARIGCPLFERRGGGARPTAAGRVLADGSRALLERRAGLLNEVRRRAAGESGTLPIAFNETVSWSGAMPEVIRRFRTSHAGVHLVSMPMSSAESRAALADGRVKLAFMFGRPSGDPALAGQLVAVEPIMLATHKDDPLAAAGEPVDLAALRDAPLIWFSREASPAYHDQMLAVLRVSGVLAEAAQVTANTSAMLALVNAGAGYTFVPAAAEHRKPADVVLKRLARPDLDQRLELVWRADDTDPLTERFIACCRAVLAE